MQFAAVIVLTLLVLKENPEWSNEAVAQHCGFSDCSYFHKVFQKTTGMTPAQYQKQFQSAHEYD